MKEGNVPSKLRNSWLTNEEIQNRAVAAKRQKRELIGRMFNALKDIPYYDSNGNRVPRPKDAIILEAITRAIEGERSIQEIIARYISEHEND